MPTPSKGNCYLCGGEFGKVAMKNHIMKAHGEPGGDQKCYLLKIEGAYDKNYWLYVDVPMDETLDCLDMFLREIWLECCGHMSRFSYKNDELDDDDALSSLSVGQTILHEYDFGTTTETIVTVVAETVRKKQKKAVRLLARNIPPSFDCSECGKPATVICNECVFETDNPFLCDDCAETHEHEGMMLPVTNSPRMGECGYDGELDTYTFIQDDYPAKK